jgi:hypothetical protein
MEANKINFAAMPQTAVRVVTSPAEFFKEMPKTGGFLEPLVFAVIMGFIAGIIYAVLSLFGAGYGAGYGGMSGLRLIIFMPIAAAIGSFIGGAILFVIWKLAGSQEDYETAYRCGAYLMSLAPITAIISVVPYAGGIINMAIYVFYMVTVSINVHNIPSQKAWLVFGIIGIIFALLGFRSEYSARHMSSAAEQWQKAAKESAEAFKKSARDMERSSSDMQKQAEEMARQFQKQAEEAGKQAEQNK